MTQIASTSDALVPQTAATSTAQGITLTPLAPPNFPQAYLLTIDGTRILLDCGTLDAVPQDLDTLSSVVAYLSTLATLAPTLSLVLVSHPLLSSLGLLPWLKARCGLRCPVYATLPTKEMGRWAVEEWVEAKSEEERNESRDAVQRDAKARLNGTKEAETEGRKRKKQKLEEKKVKEEELDPDELMMDAAMAVEDEKETDPWDEVWKLTLSEVRDAFFSINAIRWNQPVHLSGPLKGYLLLSHRSGHTLGGSLFTLRPTLSSSAGSTNSFLYAPIFNHLKEHHLDGAALLEGGARISEGFRRMGVVLVGAERSLMVAVKRSERERALLDLITKTLESSHSVLLPTDPSARLLELLVLLESHWTFANLGRQFPLVLISRTGKDVTTFVRSLTEWFGGQVGESEGVLKFSNVKMFPSLAALNSAIPAHVPKLILTVPSTLSHGISRELFVQMASTRGNVVVLTGRSEEGSLARSLWNAWEEKQAKGEKWGEGKLGKAVEIGEEVKLEMKKKVYLEGEELVAYEEKERLAAEAAQKKAALLERSRRMLDAAGGDDSDSESGSDDDSDVDQAEGGEIVSRRRRVGGFTGGAGAWDEFLDLTPGSGEGATGAQKQSFDVYVKGAYAVRSEEGGLGRFRMFPVIERKRRVDAYGEAIDVEGWLKRGVDEDEFTRGARLALENAKAAGKRAREEEEKALIRFEPPHKYVVETVDVQLLCSIFVVDMEGRADGRALKTILPQINPRKLVIVDGTPAAINDLAESCKSVAAMTREIFAPKAEECIVVGEETKNFTVRLGDSIMASLRMSRVDDYDVAYVSGTIHFDPESDIPILERASLVSAIVVPQVSDAKLIESASVPDEPKLEDGDASAVSPSNILPPLAPSLFIGDLRLTLLKDRLQAINVPSEFAGEGVLVCGPAPPESFQFAVLGTSNADTRMGARAVAQAAEKEAALVAGGKVAVKKVGRGRLVLEGTPGETFQVVRRVVYSMHAQAG